MTGCNAGFRLQLLLSSQESSVPARNGLAKTAMALSVEELFSRGIAAFQSGRLGDAERYFTEVLQHDPKHVAALNLLGILLTHFRRYPEAEQVLQSALNINSNSDVTFYNYGIVLRALKRPSEAVERFSQALAINSTIAETWNNRGTVLNDLRRHVDAISDFNKAIALNPNYSEAFCNKGKSYGELKRYDEAISAYDKALALKPDLAEAWLGRGNVFFELEHHDEAIAAYDKALSLKPDLAEAWQGCGKAYSILRRYDEAFVAYDKALALKPDFAEAWLGRGNVFTELRRYDEAFAAYDKALALKPGLAEAWLGRGSVFIELRCYEEAFAAYDKALAIKTDLAEGWLGRGNVFNELRRYDEAFAAYDRALALKPDLAEAWVGRGNVYEGRALYEEACAAFDKAISLKPDLIEAYFNKAGVELCVGHFAEGWDLYEWRSQARETRELTARLKSLNVAVRQDRTALKGKTVAILSEQGIGDEIMFASMLPDLIKDARAIYYEVDPRLTRLFESAFPGITVASRGEREHLSDQAFDVVLQAGSLGYAYRRNPEAFPRVAYLGADPALVTKWKSILEREAKARPKIGISWRGGTDRTRRDQRSIQLEQLPSIITREDCYFVSLQHGDVRDEIGKFNLLWNGSLHVPFEDFSNFDQLAALIKSLDLIISVQNTTIHMCGALGQKCWGMIPWRPEWRYGSKGKKMIWYSTVDLYRPNAPDDWQGIIGLINSDLTDFAKGHRHD
jgi:tetratricopeptide (TPR) repeat protein